MKKILTIVLFLSLSLFAKNEDMIDSILKNVLVKNTQICLEKITKMQTDLGTKDVKKLRDDFSNVVFAWKKVQATYIAGDLNEDLIDTPHIIDNYHQGNESISEQLSRIRISKNDLNTELFRNSHKSINALEYILFAHDKLNKKDFEIAKKILDNLSTHIMEVLKIYKNPPQKFLKDTMFANSAILNALIDSVYKTKQWRLGEALAKEKKFKSKDASRFEYQTSKQSLTALRAIEQVYDEVLNAQAYEDFGDMALANGAKQEITDVRNILNELKTLLNNTKEDELLGKKGEKAYELFNQLYLNYAIYMVGNLQITAKIIEADGD